MSSHRLAIRFQTFVIFLLGALSLLPQTPVRGAANTAWSGMDYGPFLTATLEVAPDNLAYKGLAIRLDQGPGGIAAGSRFVLFDTDTLRVAAAWQGEGFIDWRNIAFDGSHNTHARIVGTRLHINPDQPGWSIGDDRFEDGRLVGRDQKRYGPIPRTAGRWLGHYRHGQKVILSYLVGETPVLEQPTLHGSAHGDLFVRTFNLGPRPEPLILQVARRPGQRPRLPKTGSGPVLFAAAPAATQEEGRVAFDGATALLIENSSQIDLHQKDFTIHARLQTEKGGTILAQTKPEGPWVPDGKTFFIRNGRLCYDIGWVGVACSRSRVDDGQWHDVALTYDHRSGTVRFYIDGRPDPAQPQPLQAKGPVEGHLLRIGFTAPDFPDPSHFQGHLESVRLYERRLSPAAIAALPEEPPAEGLVGAWQMADVREGKVVDRSGQGRPAVIRSHMTAAGATPRLSRELAVAVVGAPAGWRWLVTEQGDLRLYLPAGTEPLHLAVVQLGAEGGAAAGLARVLPDLPPLEDAGDLVRGGPGLWTQAIETRPSMVGQRFGPFQVESINLPHRNPYHAWMRLGGFDFFGDGDRAAVCTWQGDVWIVDQVRSPTGPFTWRRMASGMFQPLGLRIVGEEIFVTCRDQITRLHDLNGDGETDFYESFNHDAQVTDHFHEFAMDLQTDAAGNFYYAKGACHAKEAIVPQHGTLLKVSPDGGRTEVVASGFRAPNGVCVNPNGSFILSDQEGHWTPKNRINHVVPGGFYGYMSGWTEPDRDPQDFIPPMVWIHNSLDRSPAEPLRVPSGHWGPLEGGLISLSYGTGKILWVMPQRVDDQWQGGVVELPMAEMPTGIMRGRFHPVDDRLYTCGLFGWSSDKTRPGGFFRIAHTGRPLRMPVALEALREGIRLTFTDPLDPESARDPEAYAVERFNYKRRASYGSRDYKVSDPDQQGRDEVTVTGVRLSQDRRSVLLLIPDMQPSMQMEITYRLRSADGARLAHTLQNTIHAVPGETGSVLPRRQ